MWTHDIANPESQVPIKQGACCIDAEVQEKNTSRADDVTTVVVDGKVVMRHGAVRTQALGTIHIQVRHSARQIAAALLPLGTKLAKREEAATEDRTYCH